MTDAHYCDRRTLLFEGLLFSFTETYTTFLPTSLIESTITLVSSVFSCSWCIWLDTRIVLKNQYSKAMVQWISTVPDRISTVFLEYRIFTVKTIIVLIYEIPSFFDQRINTQGGHFDPSDIFANISQMTRIFICMSAGHF